MGPESMTVCGDIVLEDMDIVVERVHDGPPAARTVTEDVSGKDGTVLREITYEPRTITLECRAFKRRWEDFDTLMDTLTSYLLTHGEMDLIVRTHPDEHYRAYIQSITEGDRIGGTGIGYFELEFTASEPWRYGAERTLTIPSGSSATFLVNGNMTPTVAIASEAAVRSAVTELWGVRFDNGDFLHIATGSDSSRVVQISSETRTARVGGNPAMVTLDSDWPRLQPGRHTVQMDQGTGAATLTWQERSL